MAPFELDAITARYACLARQRYCNPKASTNAWNDAVTVGRYLTGDPFTIEHMMFRDANGFFTWEITDLCLFSLMEALTEWRRRSDANTLPADVTIKPAPVGESQDMGQLADHLMYLGMWGERTEYEHPTQVNVAGRAFLDVPEMTRLPGWTWQRLGELYAIGFDEKGWTGK